ncbi:Tetratricopeptide repeat protein 7B [Bagarius yarrelli]|uniref:Tetratricopeptide repeat protein 7B n=1 Tax=Bagarius yarrelli TaxID=175774 RepID=A0A556VA08_BAGYA|nr:Tetratricopeptide repeat protein 7B [Bagarius yarrelli]
MTARKSGSRIETEIERCRSEGQWDKIPELVRQLSAKLISNDDVGEVLLGEMKLQQFLKENPLKQNCSPRTARPPLTEARAHLTNALQRGNLRPELQQEALMLMGKLFYVEGNYTEALSHFSLVNLDDMQLSTAPIYRLAMIAEAYATKGLCLEKMSSSVPLSSSEQDQIISCYEKSGDTALLYLQEAEKALSAGMQNRSPKPGSVSQEQELGFFLETGLQRAHVIHFKNGNLTYGVGRFREILRAVETRTTQNLRMSYWSPLEDPPAQSPLDEPLCTHTHSEYTLPRRARIYTGDNLFCPQENTEEALLLLLISESMHSADRVLSLQSASVVYDLLTIALGRRGQYEMLSELDEGECFAQMVVDMQDKAAEFRAKGYLALGLVYSLKATDGSVHALSVAASRVEQALSEASSLQSSTPKHGPLHPWMTLAQIWLHAAEVYIGMMKPAEAMACTQEAASLFPTSHNVLFMKGQVAELRGNLDDAKRCYEEALAISPAHIRSMQRLGVILYQLQRFSLAEKVLCEAVQLCSSSHSGWRSLAEVLQAQGNMAAASECFLTALQLEASNPIMPFTILPRAL